MSHFLLWQKVCQLTLEYFSISNTVISPALTRMCSVHFQMVRENLQVVMFLEDDIRFEPDFRKKLDGLMTEAKQVEWDFM